MKTGHRQKGHFPVIWFLAKLLVMHQDEQKALFISDLISLPLLNDQTSILGIKIEDQTKLDFPENSNS